LLSAEVEDLRSGEKIPPISDETPDNPAYMNLRAQIIAAQTEMDALYMDRRKIQKKLESYQQKIEILPMVEEEYSMLTLDYENAKHKYNEILNKLLTAKISEEMDTSQRGERFTIMEPALLPIEPYKPESIKIILLGFVVGTGIGLGLVALFEGMDHSVRTAEEVENLINTPVLASISFFHPPKRVHQRQKN
jgi:uncharacterized protein involved in exopolysaccharide biosynthesis